MERETYPKKAKWTAVMGPNYKHSKGYPTEEKTDFFRLALERFPKSERWKLGREKQISAQTGRICDPCRE